MGLYDIFDIGIGFIAGTIFIIFIIVFAFYGGDASDSPDKEIILIVGVSIAFIFLFIYALTNIVKSTMSSELKIMWIIICFLFGPIGVVAYFLFKKDDNDNK